MKEHLSNRQIEAFRTRTLPPAELIETDYHLLVCPECRLYLIASGPWQSDLNSHEAFAVVVRLWQEICQLPREHRIVYLLGFRDCDGDLLAFPAQGVANIRSIGRALSLTEEVLAIALSRCGDASLAASIPPYEDKFFLLWNHLPLDDATVAAVIGRPAANVARLRFIIRERLILRMKRPQPPQREYDLDLMDDLQ